MRAPHPTVTPGLDPGAQPRTVATNHLRHVLDARVKPAPAGVSNGEGVAGGVAEEMC
jgi:hypothetical protein